MWKKPGEEIVFDRTMMCERPHNTKVTASWVVVGEVSNEGFDMVHVCDKCYSEYLHSLYEDKECSICHKETNCSMFRKSNNGTVYYACHDCLEKDQDELLNIISMII